MHPSQHRAPLRDLQERLPASLVIVTHDLTRAASHPRTIAVRDSRVVEDVRR